MHRFCDSMEEGESAVLDELFSRAVYASGMALSVFKSPYWDKFFKKIRPAYVVPSPYMLSNRLLDAEYEKCVGANNNKIKSASALGIMTDSYTNIRHESVIDIIITTPRPVLHKQVYRGLEKETGEYVGNELKMVIAEIGPDKFWILVMHNANMQKTGEIVVSEYPHITSIGCASHCWHLYFEDLI